MLLAMHAQKKPRSRVNRSSATMLSSRTQTFPESPLRNLSPAVRVKLKLKSVKLKEDEASL